MINVSLTLTLEKSKGRILGIHEARVHDLIMAFRSKGARFVDLALQNIGILGVGSECDLI
jgi:hypothetical protein